MSKSPQHHYSSLADLLTEQPGPRISVCIVTPDLLGPVKNGGIGTACTHLAYALAEAGHQVDVLFSQYSCDATNDAPWVQNYKNRSINVYNAKAWDKARGSIACFPNHAPLQMALVVHDWLAAAQQYDIVIFMEWQGHGFYALHAKKCGLHFQSTVMAVVTHSPSFWHSVNNAATQFNPLESCTWHMERYCIEMADAVISPSVYMLNWCSEHEYKTPKNVFVQPNILKWDVDIRHESDSNIDEVVFFGRLEYRKGLEQFCAALDILAKQKKLPKRITFLGKCSYVGGEHAVLYVARRAKAWKSCAISLKLHCDHVQAVQYLCGKGRMAVMPSVVDNSPYSVYECLVAGIPFVARAVGGVAELIAPQDREAFLFGDNPHDLAQKLIGMLGKAPHRSALYFDRKANTKAWCEGLPRLVDLCRGPNVAQPALPFISVCLTHYKRPHLLKQAVESLLAQDYQHFEVILADDGSTDAQSIAMLKALTPVFSKRGWKILRLPNGYLGKARNIAAKEASGTHLLFMDDDNVAKPDMLRCFAHAAAGSKADLVVSTFDVFSGNKAPTSNTSITERYLPLGNAVAYATISNLIGDSNSLIRREIFEHYGGFTEDYGLGHEDFELYLRVVLGKGRISIIPQATFWYRRNSSSMLSSTNIAANRMRSLRPFLGMWPVPLAELALMTHGMSNMLDARATEPLDTADASSVLAIDVFDDPQSDAVLLQAATALSHNGQQHLADSVLASIADAALSTSARATLLCIHARQAASEGDMRALQACLEEFDTAYPSLPDASNAHERSAFYTTVLQNMPVSSATLDIRKSIVDCLSADNDKSIDTHLILSKHNALMENIDIAIENFCKALAVAEQKYRENRKDVDAAIQNGSFICALQHYSIHGKADKTPWPKKHVFYETLKSHPLLFSGVCNAYMHEYTITDHTTSQRILKTLTIEY